MNDCYEDEKGVLPGKLSGVRVLPFECNDRPMYAVWNEDTASEVELQRELHLYPFSSDPRFLFIEQSTWDCIFGTPKGLELADKPRKDFNQINESISKDSKHNPKTPSYKLEYAAYISLVLAIVSLAVYLVISSTKSIIGFPKVVLCALPCLFFTLSIVFVFIGHWYFDFHPKKLERCAFIARRIAHNVVSQYAGRGNGDYEIEFYLPCVESVIVVLIYGIIKPIQVVSEEEILDQVMIILSGPTYDLQNLLYTEHINYSKIAKEMEVIGKHSKSYLGHVSELAHQIIAAYLEKR
jgi:hypothetical protein